MLQLKKAVKLSCLGLPLKKALQVASQIGADAVELNAVTDIRMSEMTDTGIRHFKKILSDLRLKVSALQFPTRSGFDDPVDLERRIDGTRAAMDLAFKLGANVVVNRIGAVPEPEDQARWSTMVEALSDLGRYSHRAGAMLAADSNSDRSDRLLQLIQALPEYSIGIDFDAGGCIFNGESPEQAMERLAPHVLNFRARDAVRDLGAGKIVEVSLGRGSVDLPNLLARLEENNYRGYLTVQREGEGSSVEELTNAIKFLDALFA